MDKPNEPDAPRFRAILTPNRSLSPAGFLLLMALVTGINVIVGIVFLVLGAWPVFVFCGLDVALIYVAFRLNYRSGRLREAIEIDRSELRLTRIHPSGAREHYRFNPYWARVRLQEHASGGSELSIASHGKVLTFARFLNDDERRALAEVLRGELQAARA